MPGWAAAHLGDGAVWLVHAGEAVVLGAPPPLRCSLREAMMGVSLQF